MVENMLPNLYLKKNKLKSIFIENVISIVNARIQMQDEQQKKSRERIELFETRSNNEDFLEDIEFHHHTESDIIEDKFFIISETLDTISLTIQFLYCGSSFDETERENCCVGADVIKCQIASDIIKKSLLDGIVISVRQEKWNLYITAKFL